MGLCRDGNIIFGVFDAQVNIHYMVIVYYSKTYNQSGTLQRRKRSHRRNEKAFSSVANYLFEINS